MSTNILVVSVFIFFFFFLQSCVLGEDITVNQDTVNQINSRLTAANELVSFIENGKFHKTLTKMVSAVGPYLSIVGPFVSTFLAFFGQESDKLRAIKQLSKNIDRRFNKVDKEFSTLKRMIKWKTTLIQFGTYEHNIHSVLVPMKALNQLKQQQKLMQRRDLSTLSKIHTVRVVSNCIIVF